MAWHEGSAKLLICRDNFQLMLFWATPGNTMKLPITATAKTIARLLGTAALSLSLATVATQAAAVPVALINGSGQLTGATGVVVGAVTYNVSFVDGSCISLFGGCVNASFDFHTQADALAASQALFTQIISGFGNQPDRIFGCGSTTVCTIDTPGTTLVDPTAGLVVQGGQVVMRPLFSFIGNNSFGNQAAFDSSGNNFVVYADWSVATTVGNGVPEPGSLALLGLGMAALGWSRRRHVAAKPALQFPRGHCRTPSI